MSNKAVIKSRTHLPFPSLERQIMDKYHPDPVQAMWGGMSPPRAWRLFRNLTLTDVAEATGIRMRVLHDIEHNFTYARMSHIHALAKALEIHPADFSGPSRVMTGALLSLLMSAVEADDGVGRPYAVRARDALKKEAETCVREFSMEFTALTSKANEARPYYQHAAYETLRNLTLAELDGPVFDEDIRRIAVESRGLLLEQKNNSESRQAAAEEIFAGCLEPFYDVVDLLLPSEKEVDACVPLWDIWQRVLKRGPMLRALRANPVENGFEPWAGTKWLRKVGIVTWDEAFARFRGIAAKAFSADESAEAEVQEQDYIDEQISAYDSWMNAPRMRMTMDRFRNRQVIMGQMPGIVDFIARSPSKGVKNGQFRLANRGGPR